MKQTIPKWVTKIFVAINEIPSVGEVISTREDYKHYWEIISQLVGEYLEK